MNSDYEKLIKEGYIEEEVNPDLSNISSINLSTSPMAENREDKSVEVINSAGISKKTSSIMMGYNKDKIKLPDGTYISSIELEQAIDKELSQVSPNTVIIAKSTGKKVDVQTIKSEIKQILDKKAQLSLDGKSKKITNQETEMVSIKGEEQKEFSNKGVFMFGNQGINMPEDKYVSKEEFEKKISDYSVMKPIEKEKTDKPIGPNNDEIEVIATEPVDKIRKKYKKGLIVAGGLTAIGISMLPVIIPGIMHANSVLWANTNNPVFKDFLHEVCNCNLGALIKATYDSTSGIWTASNGVAINATAAEASLLGAIATHAINATSIGIAAKNLMDAIKAKKEEKRRKKIEKLNELKGELQNNNTSKEIEGGLSK